MATKTQGWIQDPNSVLDYTFDWSEWLAESETITAQNIEISPTNHATPLAVNNSSFIDKKATIWLSGGRKNTRYRVSCTITTSENRVDTRSIYVAVLHT